MQELIKGLIVRRGKAGPATPEGRRCSNLAGQIANVPLVESDWQRANLLEAMQRQSMSLEQIQRDGGLYVHSNHGAGR
jgi:hypothetical protein